MAFKGAKGTKLLVKLGDGNSPEQYLHPCTINAEREFALELNVNESVEPNCEDPDEAGWVVRDGISKSGTITGQGMLNTPDYDDWFDWFDSAVSRQCLVVLDVDAADGGRIVTGQFLLTQLAMSGNKGERMQGSVTLQSTGALVKTNNA